MQDFARGDYRAFETLYRRHSGGLYRYFTRQCSQAQAEDLFQEVWSNVIQAAASYQATAKFTTWLYRIAHNKLVDNVRHLQVVERVIDAEQNSDTQHSQQQSPEQGLQQQAHRQALLSCLADLPPLQREVFLLKEEGGLQVKQIADIVAISLEAGKSRLRYAYQSLRQCLGSKLGVAQ